MSGLAVLSRGRGGRGSKASPVKGEMRAQGRNSLCVSILVVPAYKECTHSYGWPASPGLVHKPLWPGHRARVNWKGASEMHRNQRPHPGLTGTFLFENVSTSHWIKAFCAIGSRTCQSFLTAKCSDMCARCIIPPCLMQA